MSKIKCESECNTEFQKSTIAFQRPDITYHFPLYLISLITSLSCPIDLKRYKPKSSIWHRCYSAFSIILIATISLYSAFWRQKTAYKYLIQTVKITDVIQQALLLVTNIYAIFNVICWGFSNLSIYFEKIKRIDNHLSTTVNLRKKKIWYFIRFFLLHIIMIAMCIFDYYAWTFAMNEEIYLYYSFRLYSYYLNVVIVLQINAFTSAIQTRFEIVNERLLDSYYFAFDEFKDDILHLCGDFKIINSHCHKKVTITCLTKMHDMLCDVIDLLNNMYGYNIVLLIANIIVNCVMALNVTLLFGTGVQSAANNKDTSSGYIVFLNIAWALLCLIIGVVVAWSCASCSKEGMRTATLSYKLINLIPIGSKTNRDSEMLQQLTQLTQQVQHRKPGFTAAGFFNADNTMLYSTIGSITSYIVIVIQFNNSPILINASNTTLY